MAADLQYVEGVELEEIRPCVASLGCWWREVQELEELLGYDCSSLNARAAWDELLASEILLPHPALYVELRACVHNWRELTRGTQANYPSLLERFFQIAVKENLEPTKYGVLVAFRMRQHLRVPKTFAPTK